MTESVRRSADRPSLASESIGPIRRACDQCHSRKVKCDGAEPCSTCRRGGTDNSCSFLNPVLPKGPTPQTKKSRRDPQPIKLKGRQKHTRTSTSTPSRRFKSPYDRTNTNTNANVNGRTNSHRSRSRSSDRITNLPLTSDEQWSQLWPVSDWQTGECTTDESVLCQNWNLQSVVGSSSFPVNPTGLISATLGSSNPAAIHSAATDAIANANGGIEYIPTLDELLTLESSWQQCNFNVRCDNVDMNGPNTSGQLALQSSMAMTTRPREPSPSYSFLESILPLNNTSTLNLPNPNRMPAPAPMLNSMGNMNMPWSIPFVPVEDVSPIYTLCLDSLLKPQLEQFFERVYPMIPVYSRSYIMARLDDHESQSNRSFVALVLSMCALSLVHPLRSNELSDQAKRVKQCKVLMDEVVRLRSKWDWGVTPRVQAATASYLLFGTMFELGYTDGARLKLKEAVAIGEALSLASSRGYVGVEQDEARRRLRLFWVLSVTERAYALQRSGGITFSGSLLLDPFGTGIPHNDSSSGTLYYLARLFSFIDSDIIYCWNRQCTPSSCTRLTRPRAISILRSLGGSASQVLGFTSGTSGISGSGTGMDSLNEVQKADLLITWQWLRNRIWRLAAGHGLVKDDDDQNQGKGRETDKELSVEYIVDVASTTVAICQRLSLSAMEAHGCGFVEKLYDIASIVTELSQTCPQLNAIAWSDRWSNLLQSLYIFVTQHRAGLGLGFSKSLTDAMAVVNVARVLSGSTAGGGELTN